MLACVKFSKPTLSILELSNSSLRNIKKIWLKCKMQIIVHGKLSWPVIDLYCNSLRSLELHTRIISTKEEVLARREELHSAVTIDNNDTSRTNGRNCAEQSGNIWRIWNAHLAPEAVRRILWLTQLLVQYPASVLSPVLSNPLFVVKIKLYRT